MFEKFLGGPVWYARAGDCVLTGAASFPSVIFKYGQFSGNKQNRWCCHATDCLVKMYDIWIIDALQQLWKGYGVFDLLSLFFNDGHNVFVISKL